MEGSVRQLRRSLGVAGVAPGDSGAGVLDQKAYSNGSLRVLGVASAATYHPATGQLTGGTATRLDIHEAWIRAVVSKAAKDAGTAVPAWASP